VLIELLISHLKWNYEDLFTLISALSTVQCTGTSQIDLFILILTFINAYSSIPSSRLCFRFDWVRDLGLAYNAHE